MSIEKIPTVRVMLMEPYISALQARKIAVYPLLVKSNLHRANLSEPFERLRLVDFLAFTHLAAAAMQDPYLGLKLGSLRRLEVGPIIRHLFVVSSSLRDALDHFCDAASAFQEQTYIRLMPWGEHWNLVYQFNDIDPQFARHDIEYSMAMFCSLIRYRMGEAWKPVEVLFENGSSGQGHGVYERVFRSRVLFGQPTNGVVISTADLDKASPHLGGAIVELLLEHLRGLRHDMEQARNVSHRATLAVSKYLGSVHFSIETVAADLNMSVRSLQRHLSDEGTSFKEIVRAQRERTAKMLIRSGNSRKMADIAAALGYADETAWCRAFKSWTGVTPGRYLRSCRRRGAGNAYDSPVDPADIGRQEPGDR